MTAWKNIWNKYEIQKVTLYNTGRTPTNLVEKKPREKKGQKIWKSISQNKYKCPIKMKKFPLQ